MRKAEQDLNKWLPLLTSGYKDADFTNISSALKELSHGLTRSRPLAGKSYLRDKWLHAAYLFYYWPVSYMEARWILNHTGIIPGNCLDLGSGPGPVTFALADHGAQSVVAADANGSALDMIVKLSADLSKKIRVSYWNAADHFPLPDGMFDCITFGKILNELWTGRDDRLTLCRDLVMEAASRLNDNGVIILMEPAFHQTSRDLLMLRDVLLAEKKLSVTAPCFFKGPCPGLAQQDGVCYASIPWDVPPAVKKLSLQAGLHKESLKLSYLVLKKVTSTAPGESRNDKFVVISYPMHNKSGRTRYILCGNNGKISLSARKGEGYGAEKKFFSIRRGDTICVKNPVKRDNGWGIGTETKISWTA